MPICSENIFPNHVRHKLDLVRNLTLSRQIDPRLLQCFVFRRLLPHVVHSLTTVQLRWVNAEDVLPNDLPKLGLDSAVVDCKPKLASSNQLSDVVHKCAKVLK